MSRMHLQWRITHNLDPMTEEAVSPTHIAERVVEAILAQKLAPGERLG